MSKSFTEISQEITDWQDSVFTEATPLSAATHLQREVVELVFEIQKLKFQPANHLDTSALEKEIADCFLLIVGVAHLSGINLEAAIEEKMKINRRRIWGKPDSEGVVEHVREDTLLVNVFKDEGFPEDFKKLFSDITKGDSDGKI